MSKRRMTAKMNNIIRASDEILVLSKQARSVVPLVTTALVWNGVARTGGTVYTISCANMGIPASASGVYIVWHIYSANQGSGFAFGYNSTTPTDCVGVVGYGPSGWSINEKGQGRCNVNDGNIYFKSTDDITTMTLWVTGYEI